MKLDITSSQFQKKVIENEKPTVVDIYTLRCPNCKVIDPIIKVTAEENKDKYSIYKLNASENMEIAKRYKVLGVPTLLFFKHGILVDKKTGVMQQKNIEKRLAKILDYTKEKAAKKEVKGYFKMPWH
ncbi:MAG: thioredoxin family protein [Flavobacteriaceae bacterium]|nr:thioredoxin family protein [Flavobacteriaceae bacterium]